MPDFTIKSLEERIEELEDMELKELSSVERECREDIEHALRFLDRSKRMYESQKEVEEVKGESVPYDTPEAMEHFASGIKGKAEWLEKNTKLLKEVLKRAEEAEE